MVLDQLFDCHGILCHRVFLYGFKNSKGFIRKVMKNEDHISRDDLIKELENFQNDLKDSISSRSTQLKALIGGASSFAMLSSFFLGRKSGRTSRSRSKTKKNN